MDVKKRKSERRSSHCDICSRVSPTHAHVIDTTRVGEMIKYSGGPGVISTCCGDQSVSAKLLNEIITVASDCQTRVVVPGPWSEDGGRGGHTFQQCFH